VIVAWNGLMIETMARAGAALGEPQYMNAASRAADFILRALRGHDGRLLHTWRAGTAKLDAYLDDYAALANSLVSLYEATFDERWIDAAAELCDVVLEQFADSKGGGFFYTAVDHEPLIARTKELTDSSTPSGNGLAATALLRLGKLLGRRDYLEAADTTLAAAATIIERVPMAAGQMLLALDRFLGPAHELVLVDDLPRDEARSVRKSIHRHFLPRCVLAARAVQAAYRSPRLDQLFAGKESSAERPVLFICQDATCREPVAGTAAIDSQLSALAGRME
jgi:hypothetical protein